MIVLCGQTGQVVGFSKTTSDPVVAFPCGSVCHFPA
jgi:hypothetical protein